MKTPWAIPSAASLYKVALSVSIHMLIFSIPVSMVTKPQIKEMELFLSIEDIKVPPEPVTQRVAIKKPQAQAPLEPGKEMTKPINPSYPIVQNSEIAEPFKEVMKEPAVETKEEPIKLETIYPNTKNPEIVKPVKEVIKEPVKETKEESHPKIERLEMTETVRVQVESVMEVNKGPVEEVKNEQIKVESKSMNQPAKENREAFFVPSVSHSTELNTGLAIRDESIRTGANVENEPPVSQNTTGSDAGNFIETKFGASVAPAFLHREMPVYPMIARKLAKEGKVVLKLTIDENGNLSDVEVIDKASYGFTEAAVEAVKKSTFLPAKKDGKPIASRALLPIRFRLERN